MVDLEMTRSHSRPHVSNDNPFSKFQFKTLKYHRTYPTNFDSLEDAKLFLRPWFNWFNDKHRHNGIEMLCQVDMHRGRASDVLARRQQILEKAYQKQPKRFQKGLPKRLENFLKPYE